jgi:hypothetical protein
MKAIEYQVKPVTRYIVTRYGFGKDGVGFSVQIGEYQNGQQADLVADGMIALDEANGLEANRSRGGLTLGEVISGNRL